MVTYPLCKVNLGLYVTARRPDGMHELSTVFLPVQLTDTLEIVVLNNTYHEDWFHLTGATLPGGEGQDNLVMRTIRATRHDYPQIPYLEIWLHKRIPTGAGLGGGSSDAAYTLRMLNEMFDLQISDEEANERLAQLGADCAFFWKSRPAYAEGIGEELQEISIPHIKGYTIMLVKPPFGVSTREAFGGIQPQYPLHPLRETIMTPVHEWRETIGNDFERTVFPLHPELAAIKQTLYTMGADYAQMSGSGSTVLALFKHKPDCNLHEIFPHDYFVHTSLV